jgi:purine-binding chemotaxis protein CheW
MPRLVQFVVFGLDAQRYALPLASVERVVAAVGVTPLPGAPAVVHGAISVAGRIVPVLNLRYHFSLAEREIGLADHFLIANTARRTVALVVDAALGVMECAAAAIAESAEITLGLNQLRGVVRLDDGLVLIQDLERCLSPNEACALDEALQGEVLHEA